MPTIDITAGELPPPQCYANEQDRLEAYAAALIGNLNTGAEWVTSQTAPGNTALYWLRTDSSDRPIDVMKWSGNPTDLAWIRSSSEVVFAGTAAGSGGNYAITNSPAYPNAAAAYRTGQIYTFLANHTNSGACTLNVDGKGAKTITKDASLALTANDILVGQVVTVFFDGVNFQLITQKRDLTRISLKQFFTKEFAVQAIPPDGTRLVFTHGFVNPTTGVGIIPFMVRTVIKRTAAGDVSWTSFSGKTFTWKSGQEIEAAMMVHQGGVPNGAPNFLTVADSAEVSVYCQLPTLSPPSNDLFPTLFFVSAFMTPADYGIKVYAMALNPLYVEP